MKTLAKVYQWMLVVFPAALYFSYFPVIWLGGNESMNFELSIPLIFLGLFDLCGVVLAVSRAGFRASLEAILKKRRWFLFPIYATVTVLWSLNAGRGILTAAILWLLYIAGGLFWGLRDLATDAVRRRFWRVFFGSALIVAAWCILQCVLDVLGVPREATLLCAGCTSYSFGFPHPNGFAIEPQFMGNLLIAPSLAAMYFAMKDKKYLVLGFALFATLFLTFSRGAIYAFIMGAIVMSAVDAVRKVGWKRIFIVWGVVIAAFIATLNVQGLMAELGPTDDTYFTGIAKVLNHLSLGTIDVHAAPAEFDGYVEESTNTRLELSNAAVQVWSRDFWTATFGVGLGGAGQAMYNAELTDSPKEIVQNEYVSLLLEIGGVGIILAAMTAVMIFGVFSRNKNRMLLFGLAVAYGVSLMFFSGLTNALQIYLVPMMLLLMLPQRGFLK